MPPRGPTRAPAGTCRTPNAPTGGPAGDRRPCGCAHRFPDSPSPTCCTAATPAAYNLAVVVDDAAAGIDQVVRGDDLLASSPRQGYLAALLGYPAPVYAHVPLVLNGQGIRLAKRDGAVGLGDIGVPAALRQIADSLGYTGATLEGMLAEFDPAALPREPWIFHPETSTR